ncbi:MAG: hypothetical protein V4691_06560 [Pseudomonadota bacterium]
MPQVKPATSSKLNNNIKNDAEKKTKKDSEAKKKFDAAQDNIKNSQNKKTPKLKIPEFFEVSVSPKTNTAQPPLEFQAGSSQAGLDRLFKSKDKKEKLSLVPRLGFFETEAAVKESPKSDAEFKPKTKKEKFSLAAKIDFFEKKDGNQNRQENVYSFGFHKNYFGPINLVANLQREAQKTRKIIDKDGFKTFIDGRLKDWKEKYTENDADQTVIITRGRKKGYYTNGTLKNGDDAENITGLLSGFGIYAADFVHTHDKAKDSDDNTKELPFSAIENTVKSRSAEILKKDELIFPKSTAFYDYLSITPTEHNFFYTKSDRHNDDYEDLYSEDENGALVIWQWFFPPTGGPRIYPR